LRCFFLLIWIRIVVIVALIPNHSTGSQVNPVEFSRGQSSLAGDGDDIALVDFVTFIIVILAANWHPKKRFVIRTIVFYRDIWVSSSDLRLLKRHLGGQTVKKNSIVNTRCFRADDRSRR
jgi:hypothetical protein